jgi:hypothetical protein
MRQKKFRFISFDADHPFESIMIGQGKNEKVSLSTIVYLFLTS